MPSKALTDAARHVFHSAEPEHTHEYLYPTLFAALARTGVRRLFELGCGRGALAARLSESGYDVTAVEPVPGGVQIARDTYPGVRFELGSSEEDLVARFGRFDCVLSVEVIEHVFYPDEFAARVADLLNPGGHAVITTPYHGYIKNLALSVADKWDAHFTALWRYGHVKFFSRRTLGQLFTTVGLSEVEFHRVGRIPQLAKSMVCVYRKP